MTHGMFKVPRDPRYRLLMALRSLQGTVAGTVIGLGLFMVFVHLSGPTLATEEEDARLLLAFLFMIGLGAALGAIAGAIVGGGLRR